MPPLPPLEKSMMYIILMIEVCTLCNNNNNNLSIFWLVFIIPGELVSDDCIYTSPERFLDFL